MGVGGQHTPTAALTPGNDSMYIVQEEGAQAQSGGVKEITTPCRDSIPGR